MSQSSRPPDPLHGVEPLSNEAIVAATRDWVVKAVIGLNLCPFAKAVHVKRQIRYVVSHARTVEALLEDLLHELQLLAAADPADIDTTLLVHPWVLEDFLDYNDFLDLADAAVEELGLQGELQVASFHPDYRFANSEAEDMGNYSNRSPFPTLHLLREESVDRAVAVFPEAERIWETNVETLRRLGPEGWARLGLTRRPG
ncbi:MAG TPA: DUF1415 domain-containing protein [Arenimonas sp.]|nr:DUF1415 domain-containing protein [Arenimonas sp.]